MGFHQFDPAPAATSDNAFAVLEGLASDATAVELKLAQGDHMAVTAGGALKVDETAHGWTVSPPPRRNLVVTLSRPGAAVDATTGETLDRLIRKQLPLDCVLVIPRPFNAERLALDTSDRRKLALNWDNSSPLDNHNWGVSR